MFLKRLERRKSGKKHTYWALVESIRTARGSRHRVVAYLGELKKSERSGWAQLGQRLNGRARPEPSLFDPPHYDDPTDDEPVLVKLKGVRLQRLRDFGDVWLALGLWRLLGLDTLLARLMPEGRREVPWPVVAAILTIARFCEPSSELHIADTWYRRTALEDLLGVGVDQVNDDRLAPQHGSSPRPFSRFSRGRGARSNTPTRTRSLRRSPAAAAVQCREWLDDKGYDHDHLDRQDDDCLDDLREIVREKLHESDNYAPIMSYYYPLPNLRMSAERAQAAIEDTNCVVVNIQDEYGDWETVLALSAGGMDLSWDICEAYMLLGYLPPLHFCRLPRFAGWRLTGQRALRAPSWVALSIAGCNRSCQVAMAHAKSSLRDLRSVRHALKANNAA